MVTMSTGQTTDFIFVFEEFDADCTVITCLGEEFVGDGGGVVVFFVFSFGQGAVSVFGGGGDAEGFISVAGREGDSGYCHGRLFRYYVGGVLLRGGRRIELCRVICVVRQAGRDRR
jgi:hypothetical protein